MCSVSFVSGSGGRLSLSNVKIPLLPAPVWDSSEAVSRQLEVVAEFEAVIDNALRGLVDDVLTKICGFFLEDDAGTETENIFCQKFTSRKMKMAIVQCNVPDVERLIKSLLDRLQMEVNDPIVVKSGDMEIRGVVNRIRENSCKGKPLVVVEQAEAFSPCFLDGLIYSMASIHSDAFILLCLSTKKTIFSFSLPDDIFDLLVPAVILNPMFTSLRLDAEFSQFLRSSFFRDNFSVSHMKKCLRFAFLRHLFISPSSNVTKRISKTFASEVETYMGVLNFLHTNLYDFQEVVPIRRSSHILQLHEDVQMGDLGKVKNRDEYKNWMQSLNHMSHEEISNVLQQRGIASYGIQLESNSQNQECSQVVMKLRETKTTSLHLKKKMEQIICAKQRNPYILARQKALCDIENVFRSVLRPFSSFSHYSDFLVGRKASSSLMANTVRDVETSLVMESASPLNVALRALLKQGRWRTVTVSKWGETFTAEFSVQMSDDQDIVCEDSSSNASSAGSFENVSAAEVAKSSTSPKISDEDSADKKESDTEPAGNVENKESGEEHLDTSVHTRRAISNLVKFSAAMFVMPLLVMFTTYHYVFRDYYHLPPDKAMLYAGFCGIAVVIIITIAFICVAYREEKEDEKRLYLKKSE